MALEQTGEPPLLEIGKVASLHSVPVHHGGLNLAVLDRSLHFLLKPVSPSLTSRTVDLDANEAAGR